MDHNVWTQVVGLSGSFGLGMCFAILGSIAVKMMPRMGIDQAKFGSMISAFMFACLIASLAVGVMMDSLGYKTVAIIGFAAAATSILMLANAKSFQAGLIACILAIPPVTCWARRWCKRCSRATRRRRITSSTCFSASACS